MKKVYETPAAEKIEFRYSDQVVASGMGGTSCTQNWWGFGDELTDGCSHTVVVPDSGY